MKTIWKFKLEIIDKQTVSLPVNAEILTVKVQHNDLCLWALVDPDAPNEDIQIEMFGTGHGINNEPSIQRKYISTFLLHNGDLVFHVFQLLQ